ncbi:MULTISPECIES: hypothetical protein [Rhodococcus]|jgi:hypothetical protein|uniref:Uncharacterized protein n=1 Tax=Rhodococcus maanshanensis TaxID=183556 RepID=A0A1H7PIP1_9NOCA|nr:MULTISPECIES: hypothetical protein [Rhodococcus]MBP1159754.1 hypothetical protein [Rhodococcus sp. PvR099]MCZ4558127.1 hypothetical protein [Rhodococcus maanshanensis]PTR37523.1 hypothetical protein C8K38_120102 [Rhodococcus sp. OK611]SEL35155.1 hypothetical protein SAMN05444583_10855 [Rhodococcus maanshanensis]SNX93429.1 hypothetical protein SAMN05447004_120102 [Rhodococcus sp. OK270]
MRDLGSHTKDLVSAVLSYEFDGGEIDAWAIDLVRGGEFAQWRDALTDSGLFTDNAVEVIGSAWRRDPELLVDALLDGADEVSRRRLKTMRRPSLLPVHIPADRIVGFG